MRSIIAILLITFTFCSVYGAYNFTVNGEEVTSAAVGDSLHFHFEYENPGNSASFGLWLDIDGNQEISDLDYNLFSGDSVFTDGDILDITDENDGVFEFGFSWFASFAGVNVIFQVTDEEISDHVVIISEELEESYTISGTITKESGWPSTMMGIPVFCFYNVGADNILELIQALMEGDIWEFAGSHYLFAGFSNLLGDYSIDVPQDTTNNTCLLYSKDLIGLADDDLVTPSYVFTDVDSDMEINFEFMDADAFLNMSIENEVEEPIENAFGLINSLSPDYNFVDFAMSDADGDCRIPLLSGTYTLAVNASGYTPYLEPLLTVENDDIDLDIVLTILNGINNEYSISKRTTEMLYNAPNPFNPVTAIHYSIPENVHNAELGLFNIKGQLIKNWSFTENESRTGSVIWDGKNHQNIDCASGIYFCRLVGNGEVISTHKLLLVK